MTLPEWKQYEMAVSNFIQALDPNAKVRHNIQTPDKHTDRLRQRDIWIEAKLLDHFPVRVLVSCKRLKRKLNEQDIDNFHGELQSSNADLGLIYSYSGFTAQSIKKAKKIGIQCCRLYQNQPPDLPELIVFHAYCSTSRLNLNLQNIPSSGWNIEKWDDLLNIETESSDNKRTIYEIIIQSFHAMERKCIKEINSETTFPKNFAETIQISEDGPDCEPINLQVQVIWTIYEAKLEAYLIDGSYSITSGDFKGRQIIPSIDRFGEGPGPGWQPLDKRPENVKRPFVQCILFKPDVENSLREYLGPKPISSPE